MPRWKPIADDLARLNSNGELNSALSLKGLVRSNNAVMNKVKEILYKEHGDVPGRVCTRADACPPLFPETHAERCTPAFQLSDWPSSRQCSNTLNIVQYESNGDNAPKRNTSGVPEWNEAEINSVLELWNKHGRQSEWKSISLELAQLNANGQLNPELHSKGLQRTNNAVMNKVKELSGIARARRSRPRMLGNFALLPFEQPGQARDGGRAAMRGSHGADRGSGTVRSEDVGAFYESDPHQSSTLSQRASEILMSVVSPTPVACPPPVVQLCDTRPVAPVPHVSPIAFGSKSPVMQQHAARSL